MTRSVDPDTFEKELTKLFGKLGRKSEEELTEAVESGLKYGAKLWRMNAKNMDWGTGTDGHMYRKHGKTYHTGKYMRSIRSHMLSKGETPSGEIGSPRMSGLPHLLEFGHASPAGGRVRPKEHIAPAAEETFEYTVADADGRMEIVLRHL